MAVFSSIASELRSGDVFVEGAETYSDYRKELLDWPSCTPLVSGYCHGIDIPDNPKAFVKMLRDNLSQSAYRVDQEYPDLTELVIDAKGILF